MCCFDEKRWEAIPESQRDAIMQEYGALIQGLDKSGHHLAGAKLQSSSMTTTVRSRNGKLVVTDGPFVETKEQLGGILILEANDLNHAIQLMSKHPGVRGGPFEIRPAADLTEMIRDSERRRAKS
jgi:hypothetical protein